MSKALMFGLIVAIFIAGCTSPNNGSPNNPSNTAPNNVIASGSNPPDNSLPGNNTGRFRGNLSDAQRQQFMQQRIDACNGKQENDTCAMTSPRGEINGTCQPFNETLSCMVQRQGMRNYTNFTRSAG